MQADRVVRLTQALIAHAWSGSGGGRGTGEHRTLRTFPRSATAWRLRFAPHGLLIEFGLLGAVLFFSAWLVWRTGYQLEARTSWQRAVWGALLVCGLGSEVLLTLPVLGLLASQLSRHDSRAWAAVWSELPNLAER